MRKLIVMMTLLGIVISALTTGCGGGGSNNAFNPIGSDFRLLPTQGDLPSMLIDQKTDGTPIYDANISVTTKVSFIWTPSVPEGVTYSVSHLVNGQEMSQTKGGPYEIGGAITVTPNVFGEHVITVTAKVPGQQPIASTIVLSVGKG